MARGTGKSRLAQDQEHTILFGLAMGRPATEIAKEAKCHVITVYRRLESADYARQIETVRKAVRKHIEGRLVALGDEAVDVIERIMRAGPPEQQRLAAEGVLKRSGVGQPDEDEGPAGLVGFVPVVLVGGRARRLLPDERIIEGEVVRVGEEGTN